MWTTPTLVEMLRHQALGRHSAGPVRPARTWPIRVNLLQTRENMQELRDSASSFHWLSSSIFSCCCLSFVVPHRWHLLSSPLYDVSEHTNHIFSVRIWSWQHVSVNISSVAELSPVYCCLVFFFFRGQLCICAIQIASCISVIIIITVIVVIDRKSWPQPPSQK